MNREIINVNGSGIGLRHQGKILGLATLCGGGGVSVACALEMV